MEILPVIRGLRSEFLEIIYRHYPDHKKVWKAEDIEKAFNSAMYSQAIWCYEKVDEKERNDRDKKKFGEMSLEIDALHEIIRKMEDKET